MLGTLGLRFWPQSSPHRLSGFRISPTGNVKTDRPSPHRLTLSAGDLIEVNILDEPDLSGKVRVSQSGDVTLILGGRVHVEGLTSDEAAWRLRAAFEKVNLFATRMYLCLWMNTPQRVLPFLAK